MKKLTALCALCLTTLPAGFAAAQDTDVRSTPTAPDVLFEFRDHAVDGSYQAPEGARLHVRRGAGHGSLVRARSHFVPELAHSIEQL